MLSKLPGTQDMPRKEQREIPDFFPPQEGQRRKDFARELLWTERNQDIKCCCFSVSGCHLSKFHKVPASLCINCKVPVAAFWDDLHWLLENLWRVFERGIFSPCSFCANCRSALAPRRALRAGCGCVSGIKGYLHQFKQSCSPSTPHCFLAHTLHHQLCQHAVCVACSEWDQRTHPDKKQL